MSSHKRNVSEIQVCNWIEDGEIEHVLNWRQIKKRSLGKIRTSCGSNLMVIAPHPFIAEWLEEEGVDIEDSKGDLLCNSYQSVAEWLTKKSISIVPALKRIDQLEQVPLSPSTRNGLAQRKQELLQWKYETNELLISIIVKDTPIIKDIAKMIIQYLR
jgi:hypothetical protein